MIWITGARGFLGRHLTKALLADRIAIAGVGHGRPGIKSNDSEIDLWLNGDVTLSNLDLLERSSSAPGVIFHLAGGSAVGPSMAAPYEDFERTVIGTASLLEWIRTRSPTTSLVHVSTAAVYGAAIADRSESKMLQPLSPYGTHKLMVEDLLRGNGAYFGIRASIVRFFSLYGEGLTKQLFFDLCNRLARDPRKLELGGTGREERDWLHVSDAVRQLRGAVERCSPECPTFDGGTGIGTTVSQAVTSLCDSWGAGTRVSFSGVVRSGDPQRLVASPTRMGNLAAPPWVNLDDGLRGYVAWYRHELGVA